MPRATPLQARARVTGRAPSLAYARRDPQHTALYCVLDRHLPDFLEQAAEHGGVPVFVEEALRNYLSCGVLAHGLCRFQCTSCRSERLVALSCKGRGLCPSCGGKRMSDLAAHTVDHVIPRVRVRRYVLSLPHRFRYRLAHDHARSIAVFGLFLARAGPESCT